MILEDIELSKEDFSSSGWDIVVNQINRDNFISYNRVFYQKVIEAKNSNNTKNEAIFTLLTILTNIELNSASIAKPFAYTNQLELISYQHLEVLREWISEISDLRLKARIADVLWFRKQKPKEDYQMANLAVDCHLKIAQELENSESLYSFSHIERAYRLSKSLNYHVTDVIKYIEELVYRSREPILTVKLMKLLQNEPKINAATLVVFAESIAKKLELESNWDTARNYWEVVIKWYYILKDSAKERLSWISLAENYVSNSEDALQSIPPNYILIHYFIDRAIAALRKTSSTNERVDELRKLHLKYGEQVYQQMIPFSQTINVFGHAERACKKVERKTFRDAIFSLALLGESPNVAYLRKIVQESFDNHPIQLMSEKQVLNEKGRVTARQSCDPTDVKTDMFQYSSIYCQGVFANACIEPARNQINLEHYVKINDWLPIVFNSPFVPMNREYIFAEGLDAGLKGNFMIAAHLLIPQIENSMRVLLNQRDINTTSYKENGTVDEGNINTFYSDHLSTLEQIFGEDMSFDFQGLLISRYGNNFRNLLAHGLLDYDKFDLSQFSYLWWLILRAVCLPIINHFNTEETV